MQIQILYFSEGVFVRDCEMLNVAGVKNTCYAWAGGTFFPVVLLCQFFVLAGNRLWFYILLCTQSTIQLWCCVSFFGSGRKLFLMLLSYLVYNTVVRLCQFFCCGRKANLVRFFFESEFSFSYIGIKFCFCVSFSYFVWIYNHTVMIVTQKYQELCLIS